MNAVIDPNLAILCLGEAIVSTQLFQPFWDQAETVILDGGLATELENRGADLDDPLWSAKLLLENPGMIRQVHEDYFQAGADIATGASYQASLPALTSRNLSPAQSAQILRLSVELAQEARDRFWDSRPPNRCRPLVAASIGCYGASCTTVPNIAARTAFRSASSWIGIALDWKFSRKRTPICSRVKPSPAGRKPRP